jgi:hypothetical protein
MKTLLAIAVVGSCALAGVGYGISAMVSSGAVVGTAAASAAPVSANAVVYTLPQLSPGPANPGGTYTLVATPCHPWSCSGS